MKQKPRLAIFCSGNGSNFEAILTAIRRGTLRAEVAVMVCDKPGAYAVTRASKAGIPTVVVSPKLFPSRAEYEKLILRILKSQQIDLIVLAGFMRILTPAFIRAYKGKIVNVHPSLLPQFKGAHAIRDAFQAKVKETGVTIHVVTEELDAGPILAQRKVRVSKSDTLELLEGRIHRLEHKLYADQIQKYLLLCKMTKK